MNTTPPELELLRSQDPAAAVEPDPESARARDIRSRALNSDIDEERATQRTGLRRRVVLAVAVLSVAMGATAIAQVGPFSDEWEACHAAPAEAGRDVPYPECAEFVAERVLAETIEDGSDFERRVLEDGVVTRSEYDQAATRTAECIQARLNDEVGPGTAVAAVDSTWKLGFRYDFQIIYPDRIDPNALPWEQDLAPQDATGDDSTVHDATRLTDEIVASHPTLRCRQEYFERIDRLWEAQQVASQGR